MARLTHDAQSFQYENRHLWLVGAGIDYARVPSELWADRIAAVHDAGFNTVVTTCPWMLHEPRKGRFTFKGQADIKSFVELCTEAGLYTGLRLGPFINSAYDGGGLPSWLREVPDIVFREANPAFLERVAAYLRKLLAQVVDLQMKHVGEGGIVYVQAEQGWHCSNDVAAEAYLGVLARHIRENGMNVPIFSANDLWAEEKTTIDTWTGWDDLLANLRQLRLINPTQPRIVSSFEMATPVVWGDELDDTRTPDDVLNRLAQVLAAGGQPIVKSFHGGTNFGFTAGRLPGRRDGFTTTSAAPTAPLGEGGQRTETYDRIKRLASFANSFGHVFAELDPDYQPVTIAIDHLSGGDTTKRRKAGSDGVGVVPMRGALGRIVFVFADQQARNQSTMLLLDHGLQMPINLGSQSVGWYLIDVDLGGRAWLDHANLCAFALVDRSILVLFGPEKADAIVSINESAIETTVPSGKKPRVLEHNDITIVICSEDQIDATLVKDGCVYVGASGFDDDGQPMLRDGYSQIVKVAKDSKPENIKPNNGRKSPAATKLTDWDAAPADLQVDGTHPRYATLAGPETLDACGAPAGYGWYKVVLTPESAAKKLCAIPQAGNRLHLYIDGEFDSIIGVGPGAIGHIFDMKLAKHETTIVGLADHTGRFADGNDIGKRKGWYGHLFELKPLKVTKPKVEAIDPIDLFQGREFILGQSKGRMSAEEQVVWKFTHRKKSPVLFDVQYLESPGLFLLNDEPLCWYSGHLGETAMRMLIEPYEHDHFKRGPNELRFAPDPGFENAAANMADQLTLYECIDNLTEKGSWSFARWETPPEEEFESLSKAAMKKLKDTPCWWRIRFKAKTTELPLWLDVSTLSKGQVFFNGQNVGRYFSATADGNKVGPQDMLYLPEVWANEKDDNELIIFDEHGFDPSKAKIEYHQ